MDTEKEEATTRLRPAVATPARQADDTNYTDKFRGDCLYEICG
jgi:hypothetical protein